MSYRHRRSVKSTTPSEGVPSESALVEEDSFFAPPPPLLQQVSSPIPYLNATSLHLVNSSSVLSTVSTIPRSKKPKEEVSEDSSSSSSDSSSESVDEIEGDSLKPETKEEKKIRLKKEKAEVDKLLKKQKKRINKCIGICILPIGVLVALKKVFEALF